MLQVGNCEWKSLKRNCVWPESNSFGLSLAPLVAIDWQPFVLYAASLWLPCKSFWNIVTTHTPLANLPRARISGFSVTCLANVSTNVFSKVPWLVTLLGDYKAFIKQFGIWGNLNLRPWAMITLLGFRVNSLIPLETRAVCLQGQGDQGSPVLV